jgi:hypothetical protein
MAIAITLAAGQSSTTAYNTVATSAKVMVNADTIFTAVGDIEIIGLFSECITANNATASTLQYQCTPTIGTATTISAASTTLASVAAGTVVSLNGAALSDAPNIYTTGVGLHTAARGIIFLDGTIKTVVGVGSTTGTWRHYLNYVPLEPGAYVRPGF